VFESLARLYRLGFMASIILLLRDLHEVIYFLTKSYMELICLIHYTRCLYSKKKKGEEGERLK